MQPKNRGLRRRGGEGPGPCARRRRCRTRLNTVFTTMMFTGGALGTALGAHVLAAFGWTGLCLLGAGLGIAALVVELAWGRQAA